MFGDWLLSVQGFGHWSRISDLNMKSRALQYYALTCSILPPPPL